MKKRVLIIATAIVLFIILGIGGFFLYQKILKPDSMYRKAMSYLNAGDYDLAYVSFEELNGYRNSHEQAREAKYLKAVNYMESSSYDTAVNVFGEIGDYKDSQNLIKECYYRKALDSISAGEYKDAITALKTIDGYKDSHQELLDAIVGEQLTLNKYDMALVDVLDELSQEQLYLVGKHLYDIKDNNAVFILSKCITYEDSIELCQDIYYNKIVSKSTSNAMLKELKALADGSTLDGLLTDVAKEDLKCEKAQEKLEKIAAPFYDDALNEMEKTNWSSAQKILTYIVGIDYLDADEKYAECENNIATEKRKYDGIWLCNNKFHDILKIENGTIVSSNDDPNRKEKEWYPVGSYSYDEDTGILHMQISDHMYDLTVKGDVMTITFTNKKDQYDYDWFDSGHTFTRIPY